MIGNVQIDGPVDGDVVAVFGNVNLGPHARVGGDVTAVGGGVIRDPAATVAGGVQSVGGFTSGFDHFRPWIDHCLFYGRPLALVPGIGWAWGLAFIFLALYVFLALLFRDAVTRCAVTVETQPGMTFVAALLSILVIPIAIVLLCITVIGIAAIPFVIFGAFCAGLFGKAVMLAWLGRRVVGRSGQLGHPAIAVVVGGLIVLVLYLIPVLGFSGLQDPRSLRIRSGDLHAHPGRPGTPGGAAGGRASRTYRRLRAAGRCCCRPHPRPRLPPLPQQQQQRRPRVPMPSMLPARRPAARGRLRRPPRGLPRRRISSIRPSQQRCRAPDSGFVWRRSCSIYCWSAF